MDLARNIGTLSLVLRNQVDAGTKRTVGARKVDLGLKESAPAPVVVAPSPAPKLAPRRAPEAVERVEKDRVEIIRGLHRSYVTNL